MRTAIDVELARMGYLQCPDGRRVHVEGIERLGADTLAAGARVYWDSGIRDGYAYCWSRVILLDPELAADEPWRLRLIWSEELAHVVIGRPCEEHARWWQWWRYGDLLQPVWMA